MSGPVQHGEMGKSCRIGVDLGGTKIEAVALDPDGTIAHRERIAAPHGDYAATIAAIRDLVGRIEQMANRSGSVGIAMPGSISPSSGRMQNANSTWLNGRPFDRDIEAALQRPVRLANDANCFALSEAVDGAAAGAATVFGVILGTGCGGGIVRERRLLDGPRGIGGEWGHNPLPWPEPGEYPGPTCWCGRLGCLETWVSGPALRADHAKVNGADLSAEAIAEAASAGSKQAQASLERHARRLARGLAHVINIIDPDVVVLGGGLSKLQHLYDVLPGLTAPWIFSEAPGIDIRPPRWGDASGVRGAAWLWGEMPAST